MRLPCILSAVWLQLEWVKPRLLDFSQFTPSGWRLEVEEEEEEEEQAAEEVRPLITPCAPVCSCATSWRMRSLAVCEREVCKEREGGEGGAAKRTGDEVNEGGGEKENMLRSIVNNEQFAKQIVKPGWQADGVLSYCRRLLEHPGSLTVTARATRPRHPWLDSSQGPLLNVIPISSPPCFLSASSLSPVQRKAKLYCFEKPGEEKNKITHLPVCEQKNLNYTLTEKEITAVSYNIYKNIICRQVNK